MDKFDEDLANDTVNESKLNKDIQEKLKPRKVLSNLNQNYSQLKKSKEYNEANLQVNMRKVDFDLDILDKREEANAAIKVIEQIDLDQ